MIAVNWTTFLFSSRGRINRAKYWLTALIYIAVWTLFLVTAFIVLGSNVENAFNFAGVGIALWITAILLTIAMTWSSIAIGIKRLHDREKSGWWMLLFLLGPSLMNGLAQSSNGAANVILLAGSAVVTIWAVVELGCLRGTSGANAYGPDPLGGFSREPLR